MHFTMGGLHGILRAEWYNVGRLLGTLLLQVMIILFSPNFFRRKFHEKNSLFRDRIDTLVLGLSNGTSLLTKFFTILYGCPLFLQGLKNTTFLYKWNVFKRLYNMLCFPIPLRDHCKTENWSIHSFRMFRFFVS